MKFIYLLILILALYYLIKNLLRLLKLLVGSPNITTYTSANQKDVKIEGKPSRYKRKSKTEGEYVDYEEVGKN